MNNQAIITPIYTKIMAFMLTRNISQMIMARFLDVEHESFVAYLDPIARSCIWTPYETLLEKRYNALMQRIITHPIPQYRSTESITTFGNCGAATESGDKVIKSHLVSPSAPKQLSNRRREDMHARQYAHCTLNWKPLRWLEYNATDQSFESTCNKGVDNSLLYQYFVVKVKIPIVIPVINFNYTRLGGSELVNIGRITLETIDATTNSNECAAVNTRVQPQSDWNNAHVNDTTYTNDTLYNNWYDESDLFGALNNSHVITID
ncbi:hypothetical protein F-M6_0482 [Faustovirus]|nr:hypothetical protein F-M6_0482 [Faustovirus]